MTISTYIIIYDEKKFVGLLLSLNFNIKLQLIEKEEVNIDIKLFISKNVFCQILSTMIYK